MPSRCTKDEQGNLVVTFDSASEALQAVIRRERGYEEKAEGFATWDGDKRMVIHPTPFNPNGGQQAESYDAAP
ncbi:MAG: hypothetical protein JKY71_12350 [Alphaproteobacteria bacterium]|nr:hypothetical protein [Alphaproteobacteria bacterium]